MILISFLIISFLVPIQETVVPTATIVGKIELPKKVFKKKVRRRRRSKRYGRKVQSLQKKAKKFNEYQKTLIYLLPLDEKNKRFIKKDGLLTQKYINFDPAHVVIQKGNRVQFINEDNLFHNVYSSCCSEKFNIGKKRTGVEVFETFTEVNHMQVFCDIHATMSAFISVIDSPYYTLCDENGYFKITVPPGRYKVVGWHPRAEYESDVIVFEERSTLKVKVQFN